MSRFTTFAMGAACAGVIALLVVLALKKDGRPIPPPPDEPDQATAPASSEREVADKKPAPRPSAPAVARPPGPAPAEPHAAKPLDETSMLEQLHDLAASNPPLSLKLAREAVARFPDSPNAPEFEWNVVKALFNLRQLDDAEAEARIMLSKYPGSYFTGDVVHHLLHHPPNPSDAQ
jgi:hypothetical protein